MFSHDLSDKNLLKFVLSFEIFITILIAIGILPREFAFAATAVMLLHIVFASLENSLALFILSIPFFLALPATENFDTMANWRIVLLALFFKYLLEKTPNTIRRPADKILKVENIKSLIFDKNIRLEMLALGFAIVSFFSLIGASNPGVGFKKILFLFNIFLLFLIIKRLAQNKEVFLRILKVSVLSGVFSLIIGYTQLLSILFVSLASFWQFWTNNAIAAFYGADLSILLSYSNTWFSYYGGDIPPTLRMFSVFPDSHSFALFNIILIPFILTLFFYYKKIKHARLMHFECFLLVIFLLAIIFSGSRGAWVSAMFPLALIVFIKSFNININLALKQFFSQKVKFNWGSSKEKLGLKIKKMIRYLLQAKPGIIVSAILLFFMLFPVSSIILLQTQKAEWQRLNSEGKFSSFAMFKRIRSIIDTDELSNKGRIEIWRDTLVSIKKHPALGVGMGNFTTVIGKNISAAKKGASAHNLFLDIIAETGIMGIILFLAIFYEIFKTTFSIFKNSNNELYRFFALSAGSYLFWILGYTLFDVVLFNDKALLLFMVLAGLLFGIKNLILTPKSE